MEEFKVAARNIYHFAFCDAITQFRATQELQKIAALCANAQETLQIPLIIQRARSGWNTPRARK
jgi:hypothetical protein